jgi:hypothetical protein
VAAQRIDRAPAAGLTREFEEFLHTERGLPSLRYARFCASCCSVALFRPT